MLNHISEQDLKNTLTEFFLKDSVVFFFLLYSLVYYITNFINIVQYILSYYI